MIRFAQASDQQAVISLWKCCFPGDDDFRDWFFGQIYDPAMTLVDEEQGNLCAMVQMLPYQLRDARGIRPVTYIYGACTAPEYRRQHRMDRLLQRSFELDKKQGRVASILIPQEEWLFGFYDQFGYQTAFYVDTTVTHREAVHIPGNIRRLCLTDILDMKELYEAAADVRLMRSDTDWERQVNLFDQLGAGVYGVEQDGHLKSYAFVWHDGADQLWAQECCGTDTEVLAQGILQACDCQHIRMTSSKPVQKLGCIRYHDDTPVKPGYFNLLFN